MTGATFRIQRVGIEGFKAFGTPQSLDIGDHLFIFGRNGHGKSSVVEAIRWCLFGLADRPETEVRNVFYSAAECRVELDLRGPGGGVWKMQRRLRPGSGRSDLTILGPDGTAVPQSKVFPHIARLGPREGTHIIFASQQASHRRPQADITDFDKVQVDVWAAGYFALPGQDGLRLYRTPAYYYKDSTNPYARPIEGVMALVNYTTGKVLDVIDSGIIPIPARDDFVGAVDSSHRDALKPLRETMPDGPSFQIKNGEVIWQNWHFRFGFCRWI